MQALIPFFSLETSGHVTVITGGILNARLILGFVQSMTHLHSEINVTFQLLQLLVQPVSSG
jgi:hypothetical protein